ncbi:penicillin-binding transpeptidase domain-containing protein [Rubrivirga sp.]|uniref:penicillin-binding transpeptidase domain-containing protein n=1 Tax=Rubrivirga sp. TaxID=1885344 RepID=UPI003C7295AE
MTRLLLFLALVGCATDSALEAESQTDGVEVAPDSTADWSEHFEAEGSVGTFVMLDAATGVTTRHDPDRAAMRYTLASTSKVYNGLVFLDQGVVTDVDSMLAWDGVERWLPVWNRDHSLRTGTQHSAVWLFQRLALEVGRDGYREVLEREPYGNSALSDTLETSWLDGTWKASADEQVAFLDHLRRGDLEFAPEHQALVREMLPTLVEGGQVGAANGDRRLRGKTGWGFLEDGSDIGWLVGWVERPEGDVVYAMNAQAAPGHEFDVGPARLRIVRSVLEDAGFGVRSPGASP